VNTAVFVTSSILITEVCLRLWS